MPRSASHSARPVFVKALAMLFSIRWSAWRRATSGCSCQRSVALSNTGAPVGAVCCTTTTGTPAAWAASMARAMLGRVSATGGYSMGRLPPAKYSFCTSMTIKARRGAVVAEVMVTVLGG